MLRKLVAVDSAEAIDDLRLRPAIGSKSSRVIAPDSTASASTINGASAFAGRTATRWTSRSSTITRRFHAHA
jgi:hypothetical protein